MCKIVKMALIGFRHRRIYRRIYRRSARRNTKLAANFLGTVGNKAAASLTSKPANPTPDLLSFHGGPPS